MKVFLSHSSKDKEIALLLQELIESCGDYTYVFCSSDEGAIPVAKNFVDFIFSELDKSDIFIPLLTVDYYKSRFCMTELGAAVSYLYQKYNMNGGDYIYPFCVSPITPGSALEGTPISVIEAGDILNRTQIRQLLTDTLKTHTAVNSKIDSFIHEITSIITQKNGLPEQASSIFSCAAGENVYVKNWSDFSNSSLSVDKKEISTSFNFNPYELKNPNKPDFVSTVIQFVDNIDLYRYINVRPNAEFKFTFNNFTQSIRRITVELKYGNNKILFDPYVHEVGKGKTECSFPLSNYMCEKLREINEICFVVRESDIVEDEGTYIIENIRIV